MKDIIKNKFEFVPQKYINRKRLHIKDEDVFEYINLN